MLGNIGNVPEASKKPHGFLTDCRLDFRNTAAYLRVWPGPMRDSPSLCQGLHKQRFLPYVSGVRGDRHQMPLIALGAGNAVAALPGG